MKKKKNLLALSLIFCILSSLLITPVHAAYCCEPCIGSVEQGEEKVTVNWNATSSEDNRTITISVKYSGTLLSSQEYTISSAGYTGTTEFDNSLFIKGEDYTVILQFSSYCDKDNCLDRVTKDFTFENDGMPVYDVGSTLSDSMLIETGNTNALKAQVTQSGMYRLDILKDDSSNKFSPGFSDCFEGYYLNNSGQYYYYSIDVSTPRYGHQDTDLIYFEENEQKIFLIKSDDDNMNLSVSAQFKLSPVQAVQQSPLTTTPKEGDNVYLIKNPPKIMELNIPKDGVYEINFNNVEISNNDYSSIELINEIGENVITMESNEGAKKIFLSTGMYYLKSDLWNYPDVNYDITIKYAAVDNLKFNEEIIIEGYKPEYRFLKLDSYAVISAAKSGGYVDICTLGGTRTYYIGGSDTIMPAGEYYIKIDSYQDSTATISKTDIPTTIIGNSLSYYTNNSYEKYTIIKAPESAEYEFCFPNGANIDDDWYNGTCYLNMKKDDTVFIRWNNDDFTVTKYIKEITPLALDNTTDLNLSTGKKVHLSYTSALKESYRLFISDFSQGVKVYTDSKTLYDVYNYESILNVDLEADETLYIDITPSYDLDIQVEISKRYTKITQNTTVNCINDSNNTKINEIIYTPSQAGFYDFTATKKSGDSNASVSVSVNGSNIGGIYNWGSDSVTKNQIYISPDEPIAIKLEYQLTSEIELIFEKFSANKISDISNFEIADDSYYSVTLPKTGVYKVLAKYQDEIDWVFPIIRNYERGWTSIDSEGGAIYFYGDEGEEILFRKQYDYEYQIKYPINASITYVESKSATINNMVSSIKNECFKLEITEDSIYKLENTSKNAFIKFYNMGEWSYIEGDEGVFELKAGTYYIITQMSNYASCEGLYTPTANFKFTKYESTISEPSITLDDLCVLPNGNARVYANAEVPCSMKNMTVELNVTVDNVSNYLYKVDSYYSTQSMKSIEKLFRSYDVYFNGAKFAIGETYVITPNMRVFNSSTGFSKTYYGKTKTIVAKAVETQTYEATSRNTYLELNAGSGYDSNKEFRVGFTPSQSGTVTIVNPQYLYFDGISNEYDGSVQYPYNMDSEWNNEDGTRIMKIYFEGGVKYYLHYNYSESGKAKISISSLPESAEPEAPLKIDGAKANNVVNYTISGTIPTNTILYAALYDGQRIKDIKSVNNPTSSGNIEFDNIANSDVCKLFLWNQNLLSLCNAKVFEASPSETSLSMEGSKVGNSISYAINGAIPTNSTLYTALYDGEKLTQIKSIENPNSSANITIDNMSNSDSCKLFLWDASLLPLCNSVICE